MIKHSFISLEQKSTITPDSRVAVEPTAAGIFSGYLITCDWVLIHDSITDQFRLTSRHVRSSSHVQSTLRNRKFKQRLYHTRHCVILSQNTPNTKQGIAIIRHGFRIQPKWQRTVINLWSTSKTHSGSPFMCPLSQFKAEMWQRATMQPVRQERSRLAVRLCSQTREEATGQRHVSETKAACVFLNPTYLLFY